MNICSHCCLNTSKSSYSCYHSKDNDLGGGQGHKMMSLVISIIQPWVGASFNWDWCERRWRVFCCRRAHKHQQSPLEWHTRRLVYWLLLPASQLMSIEWVMLADSGSGSKRCIIGWKKRAGPPLMRKKHICRSNYVICWRVFLKHIISRKSIEKKAKNIFLPSSSANGNKPPEC